MEAREDQVSDESNNRHMKNLASTTLCLSEMSGVFAVCHLDAAAEIPVWAKQADFCSITRTTEELSIVCLEAQVPPGVTCEKGWRGLKVEGPLDFGLVGVLASIAQPLAEAAIPIFALGTYNTDYILVKEHQYEAAKRTLSASGHTIKKLESQLSPP